jgi:hypothetical protein
MKRLFQLDYSAAAGHMKMPSAYLIGKGMGDAMVGLLTDEGR